MAEKRKRISRKTASRASVIMFVFAVFAAVIVLRLATLQLFRHDEFRKLVQEEITFETKVNPERGTIYSATGDILATNSTVYLCFIDPQMIMDAMAEAAEGKNEDRKTAYTWASSDGKQYTDLPMNKLIAQFLSDTLDVDYNEIIEKAAKEGRRYEEIADEITEETAEKIRVFIDENKLTEQIYLRAGSIRYYPYGDLASHVIGFTDSDGVGKYGIEAQYNNILEGTSGRYLTAQDAKNNDMDYEYETFIEAEDGLNLGITLDPYIQMQLENELETTMVENQVANRATGIVMRVSDGAILAMATAPEFDCNDPYGLDEMSLQKLAEYSSSEDREEDAKKLAANEVKKANPKLDTESEAFIGETDKYYKENYETLYKAAYTEKYFNLLYEMWKNKAITELYEPGSTSKILTAAMAFNENVITPNDMFTCTGGMTVDGYPKPIHCHELAGHGTVTFARGLQQSCNPTMMQVAFKIGREKFYNYFLDFGYGSVTGVDLPNEARTMYHRNFNEFSNVSLAVYSFGQTYKTTPIQQITAISAIANGGYVVTPHILNEVTDGEGNVIKSYGANIKRQVVSTEVCKTVAGILQEGVSTDGGARNAYVKGYKVAAKTGTSEKTDIRDEGGNTYLRVGSCIGFAPADNPEVAVIIVVDEPMGGSVYGSVVAAPYVSDLLSNVLPYMGYEPEYTDEEKLSIETSVIDYTDYDVTIAKSHVTNNKMRAIVIGNGDTVTGQIPSPGSTINKDTGKIILYTDGSAPKDTIEVPDVVGKNAETANLILANAGLNISISGANAASDALVASQTPQAGATVPEGTVVELVLRVTSGAADD